MRLIKTYVLSELNFYREECNFTEEERMYFDMKAKDYSDNKICIEMNISLSKVNKLSKNVRLKMNRVDKLFKEIYKS